MNKNNYNTLSELWNLAYGIDRDVKSVIIIDVPNNIGGKAYV